MNPSHLSPLAPGGALAIRPADLADAADAAAVLRLLDAYARDPLGQGRPLSRAARACLIPALRQVPNALILLAVVDLAAWAAVADPPTACPVQAPPGAPALAVGVAVCFAGFSTFQTRGLLNLHDLALLPAWRGRGIGRRLLAAVEAIARGRGYCKVTLEVRADNLPARALYASAGFGVTAPVDVGPAGGAATLASMSSPVAAPVGGYLFCEKRLPD